MTSPVVADEGDAGRDERTVRTRWRRTPGRVGRVGRSALAILVSAWSVVGGGPAGATGDPWFERREVPIATSADEYLVLVHERRSPGHPPTVIETLSWQRFDLATNRLTRLVELRRDERGSRDTVDDPPEVERVHEAEPVEASLTAALYAFGGVPIGPSTRLVERFRATRDGLFAGAAGAGTRVLEPSVLGRRFEGIDTLFAAGSMTVMAMYRGRRARLLLIRGESPLGTQEIVLSLPPR